MKVAPTSIAVKMKAYAFYEGIRFFLSMLTDTAINLDMLK